MFAHHVVLKVFFCSFLSFWIIISKKISMFPCILVQKHKYHLFLELFQVQWPPIALHLSVVHLSMSSVLFPLHFETVTVVFCVSFYVQWNIEFWFTNKIGNYKMVNMFPKFPVQKRISKNGCSLIGICV